MTALLLIQARVQISNNDILIYKVIIKIHMTKAIFFLKFGYIFQVTLKTLRMKILEKVPGAIGITDFSKQDRTKYHLNKDNLFKTVTSSKFLESKLKYLEIREVTNFSLECTLTASMFGSEPLVAMIGKHIKSHCNQI